MAEAPACIAFIVSKLMFAFSRAKTCCSIVFFVEVHLSRSFSNIFFRCNAASAATHTQGQPLSQPPQQKTGGGDRVPFLLVVTFRFAVAVKSSICFWRWASFFSSMFTCSRNLTIEFFATSCFFLLAAAPPPNNVPHITNMDSVVGIRLVKVTGGSR